MKQTWLVNNVKRNGHTTELLTTPDLTDSSGDDPLYNSTYCALEHKKSLNQPINL